MIDLSGRAFLVTGAAGGIGRAVCEAFAQAGAAVAAVDLDPDEGIAWDLADVARHEDLVAEAARRVGPLHGLVHLAAVLRRRPSIDDITEADWDAQLDVNLKATFFLNRAVARHLRAGGRGGAIVNYTSQGWWTGGFGGSVVYAASKGGVVSLSRGLARTLAPDGIRVNTVAPGAADTELLRAGQTASELAAFVGTIPLGRMAEPAEVAGIAVFLASDHARYVTGATINVSGGQIMY